MSRLQIRIDLLNFRCYKKASFEFAQGKLIKISGPSGVGNSTIFQAIYWALYRKVQSIHSIHNDKKDRCLVTLTIPSMNLIIMRQSNPSSFIIRYYDSHYGSEMEITGDVAENFIEQTFGSAELWHSSCYIEQKMSCSFINSSNRQKMVLLNHLSFQDHHAQDIIKAIEIKVKDLKHALITLQAQYDAQSKLYQDYLAKKEPDFNYCNYTPEQIAGYKEYLDGLQQQLQETRIALDANLNNSGRHKGLVEELNKVITELESLPPLDSKDNKEPNISDKIASKQQLLDKYITQQPLNQRYRQLQQQLDQLQPLPSLPPLEEITTTMIEEARRHQQIHVDQYGPLQEKITQMSANLPKDLKVDSVNTVNPVDENKPITQEDIDRAYQQDQDYQQRCKYQVEIDNILQKQENSKDEFHQYSQQFSWTQIIYQQAIAHQHRYKNEYIPLQEKLQQLPPPSSEIASLTITPEMINQQYQLEQDYQKYLQLQQQLETLRQSLTNIDIPNWDLEKQSQLHQQLQLYTAQEDRQQKIDQLKQQLPPSINYPRNDAGLYLTIANDVIDYTLEKHYRDRLQLREKELAVVSSYGLPYDKDTISKEITRLSKDHQYLRNKPVYDEYLRLHEQYHNVDVDQELEEITAALQDIELSKKILVCPQCQSSLTLEHNHLVVHRKLSKLTLANQEELWQKQTNLRRFRDLQQRYSLSPEDIDYLKQLLTQSLSPIMEKLTRLQGLTYPDEVPTWPYATLSQLNQLIQEQTTVDKPKYTLEQGQLFLKYWLLQQQLSSLPQAKISPTSEQLQQGYTYQQLQLQLNELISNNYNRPPKCSPETITLLIEYQRLLYEMEPLSTTPAPIPGSQLSFLKNYYECKAQLAQLQPYSQPPLYKGEHLQQGYDYYKLLQEQQSLTNASMEDYSEEITQLKKELEDLQEKLQKYQQQQAKIDQLLRTKKNLLQSLEEITIDETIEERYNKLQEDTNTGLQRLQDITYAQEVGQVYKRAYEIHQQLAEVQADYSEGQDLIRLAKKVEGQHLQETVNNINKIMDHIFQDMFSRQISVKLALEKQMATGETKPEVNLHITYNGAIYPKYQSLSGGEKDRISAGLIIALNMLNKSPLLILDECLTGIEYEYRESFINALKKFLPNKTVLMITHHDLGDFFDQNISLP
mgnify:CR=1 FL=1